jgi:hypothetical protein
LIAAADQQSAAQLGHKRHWAAAQLPQRCRLLDISRAPGSWTRAPGPRHNSLTLEPIVRDVQEKQGGHGVFQGLHANGGVGSVSGAPPCSRRGPSLAPMAGKAIGCCVAVPIRGWVGRVAKVVPGQFQGLEAPEDPGCAQPARRQAAYGYSSQQQRRRAYHAANCDTRDGDHCTFMAGCTDSLPRLEAPPWGHQGQPSDPCWLVWGPVNMQAQPAGQKRALAGPRAHL